jgi:hypothetical protein
MLKRSIYGFWIPALWPFAVGDYYLFGFFLQAFFREKCSNLLVSSNFFFFDDNWFRHWGWRLISVRSRLPFCNFLDCYQCPV